MATRPVNDLPESPWAQHFNPSSDPFFRQLGDGLHHSGIAPVGPYIPWDKIDQLPPQEEQPLPSMQELDVLFTSERSQTQFRNGMPSWRLPSLLGDLSKGNDVESDPGLISVNESKWFDFLKRDRWFDLRVDGVDSIPNPPPDLLQYHNKWWTADNPAIWSKLRIVMELMNRILSTGIDSRHPWLDTILFSEIRKWSDIDPEMAKFCKDRGIRPPLVMLQRPEPQRATAADMRARLEQVLQNFVLGFHDDGNSTQNNVHGFTTCLYSQERVTNYHQVSQGNIQAVLPALRHSANNPRNLPVMVRPPQGAVATPGAQQNVGLPPGPAHLISFEALVNQAASQMTGPNGTPISPEALAAAAAAASAPVSAGVSTEDPPDPHVSTFHVYSLRCLLNTESKPFERYNALVLIANILLHEMMHAILYCRESEEGRVAGASYEEPYIFPILEQEAGHAFELSLFDGIVDPRTLNDDNIEYANGANTLMGYTNHPWKWLGLSLPETWVRHLPDLVERYSVPPLWSICMLSEEYWRTVIPRLGLAAVRYPKLVLARQKPVVSHYRWRTFGARIMTRPEIMVSELDPQYGDVQRRWVGLTSWNKEARPWWKDQYLKWSLSPWSQVEARRWLSQFCEVHARRDLVECTKLVWEMIDYVGVDDFKRGLLNLDDGPAKNLWLAIAGLMMASIPVLDGQVSRRKKAPEFWLHPGISASLRWTQPLTVHPSVQTSHDDTFEHQAGPWKHPVEGLYLFWGRFSTFASARPVPHVWLEACYNAFQKLFVHHSTPRDPHDWADFDFQIPPYDDKWASITEIGTGFNVEHLNTPTCTWITSFPPTGENAEYYAPSPPLSPMIGGGNQTLLWKQQMKEKQQAEFQETLRELHTKQWQQQQQQQQQLPPPGPITRRPGGSRSRSRSRGRHHLYPVHVSIGEVGNNMDDEDFWVIEGDGNGGFHIFSISKLCFQMGYPNAAMIRRELITLSSLGPKLRDDGHPAAEEMRGILSQSSERVGKLLVPRTAEYISEYDGQEGMPMWIIIGTTVYDITTFSFGTRMEKGQLTENPGGRPKSLPDDADVYEDLLKRLQPFRCALFEGQKAPKKTVLPPFTPAMLSWHDNPTSGMYIAVEGIIYNVTDYVERHPGGRNILARSFGREAEEFHDFHGPDTMADFAELAVGQLVPEIDRSDLEAGLVAIHDWVFDLAKLDDGSAEDRWVLPVVAHLAGKDASEAIREPDAVSNALVHIYTRRKEAIVAHIASDELDEIPVGQVAKHNDPRSLKGAWVTVDGFVFDVTTLMLHGKSIHGKELPYMWAGTEVEDEALCEWLQRTFPHRIIGRAVAGEAIPEPTVEELRKRHCGLSEADELQRRIWGIDKDDPSCGGRIRVCGVGSRGEMERERGSDSGGVRKFTQGDLEVFLRGRAAAASGSGGSTRKRSAEADGDAAAAPSVKRRG